MVSSPSSPSSPVLRQDDDDCMSEGDEMCEVDGVCEGTQVCLKNSNGVGYCYPAYCENFLVRAYMQNEVWYINLLNIILLLAAKEKEANKAIHEKIQR